MFIFILVVTLNFISFLLPLNATFYQNLPASKAAIIPTTSNVIYLTFGTLPTLYAGIHMFLHNKPTLMWFFREGTLNIEAIPNNVRMIGRPGIKNIGNINLVKNEIKAILDTNPKASFTLYTDDMQSARVFLTILVANGVLENNYQVRILSDGTGTYNYYRMFFNTSNGFDIFNNTISYLYRIYVKVLKTRDDSFIPNENIRWADLYNTMFALASFPFSELWLSHPNLLLSRDFRMNFARSIMHVREISPLFLLSNLPRNSISNFLKLFDFNKNEFDLLLDEDIKATYNSSVNIIANTANSANDVVVKKDKLIVTLPFPIPIYFYGVLKKITNIYLANYDIYLKPHPDDDLTESQIDRFKKLGIKHVFGNRIPMEIILWLYPDLKVGGFQSSLYMSTKSEQILFFITYTGNQNGLPEPLISLYNDGGFPNVKFFYQPVPIDELTIQDKDTN